MKLRLTSINALAMASAFIGATVALAGPDWNEIGDAGGLPINAQIASGVGQIAKFRGRLEGFGAIAGVADFEDMYRIHIDTPASFCIVLVTPMGTPINAQLWLFKADGTGLLGNDDVRGGPQCTGSPTAVPPSPYLQQNSNDGSLAAVVAAGDYYLAISVGGWVPVSSSGNIFFLGSSTEVSGPDGPGGLNPIIGWTGAPEDVGDYDFDVQAISYPAPPPGTGACCLSGGDCLVTTSSNCTSLGGAFLGAGTPCFGQCSGAPVGACCIGTSCAVTSQAGCSGTWQGPGTTCSPNPCNPSPLGACCVGSSCSMTTQQSCGGSWNGPGSSCSPNPCQPPPPSGACCIGSSCSITTQQNCSGSWGGPNSSCSPNPCNPPPPTGACCVGQTCSLTTQANCTGMGGTYQGDGTACGQGSCGAGIPAVSPGGLLFIVMTIAIGGAIVLTRRGKLG